MKIYDVFTFFNELDILKLRLSILDEVVDYFVLVECNETFSGLPKELTYRENAGMFDKWKHKIIYMATDDVPRDFEDARSRSLTEGDPIKKLALQQALTSPNVPHGMVHWLKEFYQKELLKKALAGLSDDDFCFVSDVDEIWNPDVQLDYNSNAVFRLRQLVYSYYLNYRTSEPWAGTIATKYANIKHACLNHLRTGHPSTYSYVDNGGWHFTNMFAGDASRVIKKIESYGHQEFNNAGVKAAIPERIRNRQDFLGRSSNTIWVDDSQLPRHILDNMSEYEYLFNRK